MMTTERRIEERTGYPPPALTAAVLAVLAIVLAVVGVWALAETSARAFATYTPVEASVVDEHGERLVVADRRGNRTETVRVVSVELPDGARADLRSADLGVGTTATVYLSSTGTVSESPPEPPSLLEWMIGAAAVVAAVVLGVLSVRVVLRLRRSS
ncbi:hypothetical protein [Agromyces mariniharenae]|uniref:Uncharacterized protein n=1 Tax=Agromyces mariniharenae TaxID=2604423 RepID=A0A5S4V2T0_9MICO|nr:hypothetical protein [Agromyces mariniharenae]TYL52309.1 hypothetical protein FYC51_00590 [Agromyces mariniharenae]